MVQIMEKMGQSLSLRSKEEIEVEAVTFSKEFGILGKTNRADEIMTAKLRGFIKS